MTVCERLQAQLQYTQKPWEMLSDKPQKVLLLGSGGLSIGQAGEFDYSGSQVNMSKFLFGHFSPVVFYCRL
jgi:hypothetical protein